MALAGCFRKHSCGMYTATGPVRVNGLDLYPDDTGKIVVDMSSISPIETKKFAAEIAKKGCGYVDAPVSGGEVKVGFTSGRIS